MTVDSPREDETGGFFMGAGIGVIIGVVSIASIFIASEAFSFCCRVDGKANDRLAFSTQLLVLVVGGGLAIWRLYREGRKVQIAGVLTARSFFLLLNATCWSLTK